MKRFVRGVLVLFAAWFIIHTIVISIDGLSATRQSAELAVILGTKVNEDGTLSERLCKRLDAGLRLFHSNRVKKILVSGGLGKEGYWEAEKMKEYLVQHGVNASDIYVDNYGNNTRLTVQNTLKIQPQTGFRSIIVVSQYFHLTRTKALFRKSGVAKVYSTPAHYFEWRDLYSIAREFFAFYSQAI